MIICIFSSPFHCSKGSYEINSIAVLLLSLSPVKSRISFRFHSLSMIEPDIFERGILSDIDFL